jgi:kynurenine 3-monooxygenase
MSRAALNLALVDAAERSGNVQMRFGQRCVDVDADNGSVGTVDATPGGLPERHDGTIIGADGAYSAVRAQLQRRERFDFSQAYLAHGYKELSIPPAADGSHRLDPHALHIWPRGGYMMMAMANLDGSFTGTLYLAFEGPNGFAGLHAPDEVTRFFERTFPDAIPLLPGLAEDFFAHPTGTLVTLHTRPWHIGSTVALLGDACHAIVPFFGQGANAAFEDCLALDSALRRHPADRARAFDEYEAERRPNAEAIADLALANFHEMRDHVASPLFRLEKRAEVLLHRLFPRWYIPLYTMISFTLIPYAEAWERSRRQKRVVRWIGIAILVIAATVLFAIIRGA